MLEGDPELAMTSLLNLKHAWFPQRPNSTEWVELYGKQGRTERGYTVSQVVEELTTNNWDNGTKFVVLRGLMNNKEMREALVKIIPQITEPHTLVIWDSKQIIESGRSNVAWRSLRKMCQSHGEHIHHLPPLDKLRPDEQLRYVVDAVHKRSRKISSADASLLLELLGPQRALIDSEVDHLVDVTDNEVIQQRDIEESVLPLASDFPVWMFYAAFNSGVYSDIMQSAEMLHKSGFDYQAIAHLAMKQARWQLLTAYYIAVGFDPTLGMHKISAAKDVDAVRERLLSSPFAHRLFSKVSAMNEAEVVIESDDEDGEIEKSGPKRETINSEANIRDIIRMVRERLPMRCPDVIDKKAAWVYYKCMERYLLLHNGMVELRAVAEKYKAGLFNNLMRALSLS